MSDGKYYWLKLKRDFFKRHDVRIIEDMENGKDYILFYLKLLVESVDHNGTLRFSDTIPYNDKMLATVTNTNIDIVRSALKVFIELNMIEILDDSTIYIHEVEKMIGSAADNNNAKRQQRLRDKKKTEQNEVSVTFRNACVTPPVTENNESKNKDKDKEIDLTPPLPPSWDFDKHTNVENYKHLIESDCECSERYKQDFGLAECIGDWMEYKDARKPKADNHYANEKSMMILLKQVCKYCDIYGVPTVISLVEECIGNNYRGIIWNKLTKSKQGKQSTEEYWRSV